MCSTEAPVQEAHLVFAWTRRNCSLFSGACFSSKILSTTSRRFIRAGSASLRCMHLQGTLPPTKLYAATYTMPGAATALISRQQVSHLEMSRANTSERLQPTTRRNQRMCRLFTSNNRRPCISTGEWRAVISAMRRAATCDMDAFPHAARDMSAVRRLAANGAPGRGPRRKPWEHFPSIRGEQNCSETCRRESSMCLCILGHSREKMTQ